MVEIDTIRILLDAGVIVVCAGGGGIPVVAGATGRHGVEAVIDKDLLGGTARARSWMPTTLVMVTDVDVVQADWGTPSAYPIHAARPDELRALRFAAGSMAPKVEAACRFAERTGHAAVIGSLEEIGGLVGQRAGTVVTGQLTSVVATPINQGGR